jgi:hypothetical protein
MISKLVWRQQAACLQSQQELQRQIKDQKKTGKSRIKRLKSIQIRLVSKNVGNDEPDFMKNFEPSERLGFLVLKKRHQSEDTVSRFFEDAGGVDGSGNNSKDCRTSGGTRVS